MAALSTATGTKPEKGNAMAVSLEVKTDDLSRAVSRLSDFEIETLADRIGAMLVNSTQLRIDQEKHGPNGEYWPSWSDDYARSRHHAQSLLVGEGHMRDSIQNFVGGSGLETLVLVNVHAKQGATHQFGDPSRNIPARPFLGVSDRDRERIESLIIGNLEDLLE